MTKHIVELDSWRGIMALVVAIFHFTAPNNFLAGELAVDFFFILSGVVLQKAYFNQDITFSNFFIKRLVRLYPLHIFSLFVVALLFLGSVFFVNYPKSQDLTLAFQWHFPDDYYQDGVLFTFLQQVFLINGLGFHPHGQFWNGPSWSVSAELWVNVIFFIWFRKFSTHFLILLSIVIYLLIFTIFGKLDVHIQNMLYLNAGVVRCLAGFCLGVAIYRVLGDRQVNKEFNYFYTCLQIICAIMLFYVIFAKKANYNDFMAIILIVILICISLLQINTLLNRFLRKDLFVFLGKISYSIYLIHYSVQYIFQSYLDWHFDYSVYGWMKLAGYLFCVIFLSSVTYSFIEKNSKFLFDKIVNLFKV